MPDSLNGWPRNAVRDTLAHPRKPRGATQRGVIRSHSKVYL
jgi:hypothetical protein